MKRFILSVLFVVVFFVGLGALVEKAGAKFRSDERALDLVRKARITIGGDSAIAGVRSMLIAGQTSRNIKVNGVDQAVNGETEIAMQLPNKLSKTIKIGHGDGTPGSEPSVRKQVEVVVVSGEGEARQMTVNVDGDAPDGQNVRKIVIKKADGTTQEMTGAEAGKVIVRNVDGNNAEFTVEDKDVAQNGNGDQRVVIKRVGGPEGMEAQHAPMRQNELLRLTLGLLMSAPEGMDVDYQFGGEADVDGTRCNIVVASVGGSSFKIFLSSSTNLPVQMSYSAAKAPTMVMFRTSRDAKPGDGPKENVMLSGTSEPPAAEMSEFTVKFSDYRSVGGVQLPYKWTQTVGGAADETFDVTNYEINPANIADKFQDQKVMVRVKKAEIK